MPERSLAGKVASVKPPPDGAGTPYSAASRASTKPLFDVSTSPSVPPLVSSDLKNSRISSSRLAFSSGVSSLVACSRSTLMPSPRPTHFNITRVRLSCTRGSASRRSTCRRNTSAFKMEPSLAAACSSVSGMECNSRNDSDDASSCGASSMRPVVPGRPSSVRYRNDGACSTADDHLAQALGGAIHGPGGVGRLQLLLLGPLQWPAEGAGGEAIDEAVGAGVSGLAGGAAGQLRQIGHRLAGDRFNRRRGGPRPARRRRGSARRSPRTATCPGRWC